MIVSSLKVCSIIVRIRVASFAKFREMGKTILRNYFRENGGTISQKRSEAKSSDFWRFSETKSIVILAIFLYP